jgi:hypothetical protein
MVNHNSIMQHIAESNLKLLECIQNKKSDNGNDIIEKISKSNMLMSQMLRDSCEINWFNDLIKK